MAFQGYFIKLFPGNSNDPYEIKPESIKINSYQVTWEGQDYSAYRDETGLLHRNALASRPPKVEFQVRNGMTNGELQEFMGGVRACIRSKEQRAYSASIYIPEIDNYITDTVYMVDPTFSIYRIDGNTIYYNSFRMAFIGYGTTSSWSNA